MISVYQCVGCNTIIGDTDIQQPPSISQDVDQGIEIAHTASVEIVRGRIKCEICKETVGTEEEEGEGRIFYMPTKVKRYVVQSAKPNIQQYAKRAKTTSSNEYVSQAEFEAFQATYNKDMSDCKEMVMVLYEQLEKLK